MNQDSPQLNKGRWVQRAIDLFIPVVVLLFLEWSLTDFDWLPVNTLLGLGAGILLLTITQVVGGYGRYYDYTLAQHLKLVFQNWYLVILLLIFIAFVFAIPMEIARRVTLLWMFLTPVVIFALKRQSRRLAIERNAKLVKVALIGQAYEFNQSEQNYLQKKNMQIEYLKFDNVQQKVQTELNYDIFVLNTSSNLDDSLVQQLTELELEKGIHILTMQYFFESYLRKCFVGFNENEITFFHDVLSLRYDQVVVKRFIDYLFAIGLSLAAFPVMLFTAFKIKKQSPGPIIFSQERVGLNAKEFKVYKFRSMHVDAEKGGAQFAVENDPRAYQFGGFMRKTRIDELPQLWNVIKGDLHLVGPRPERKVFTDELEIKVPYYNERHLIRPGITGWAQVMYPYGANTEDARQKLMYDLYYIKNWSVWLEIEIILKTILVVLGKKGL